MSGEESSAAPADRRRFASTRWSVVRAAQVNGDEGGARALAELCETYWYPLYAFLRRQGRTAEDASDLVQAFFAALLEQSTLEAADPARGRFRSFLLASLKHFAANEHRRAAALRRGGGASIISLDLATAESRYQLEPTHNLTAERVFERRWALLLLEQTLARLRQEHVEAGKERQYAVLKDCLEGGNAASYRELGEQLEMSEGAVKAAVYRLRRRYRELLLDEVAQTVDSEEEIADELRRLFAALDD